ncbi:PREDICTED: putative ATP-dependent RNA helicase DHX57 isoform X1 [Ceratosolen solmsi marchali]|uniref:Putative ATP-dependent RNA helicase DHX57 n=1 Tax=Ceratosolen solmsi marchali TaxID=326594 RepID=A0AAJ7DUL1_9HYME|nr:PREDICTED: putative ATP-dependent RNA helicase DHX57 isoform X1 [Ceratosolen solmsi marchali]
MDYSNAQLIDDIVLVAKEDSKQNFFHSSHCVEALVHAEGQIGKALEILFCKYYKIENLPKSKNLNKLDLNDLLQRRTEEKEALESIYGDAFIEKIKNQVWIIKMKLGYLINENEENIKNKSNLFQKDICRLYLQGKCRFGIKCRYIHQQPQSIEKSKTKKDTYFILEIRFPEDCKYPYEPPYFYLHTNEASFSNLNCLRIARKLYNEALVFCENGIPYIFSLISLLENEHEIHSYLKNNKEYFLDQYKCLFPKFIEKENDGPSHYKKGSINKKNRNEIAISNIIKQNNQIKIKFINKQKNLQYLKMMEARRKLPAWTKIQEVLKIIYENQVTIVSGETGCGKSTQIPQFIFDDWIINATKEHEHIEIICTQPRRISAIGVAERVAAERNECVGDTVGYQIRLESKVSDNTRLIFCTTGILLQRLSTDPQLKSVTHIIIDEVHERNAESDFLLMILKQLLQQRPNLKLILMSATLTTDIFSTYFGKIPVLDIPGRIFPVKQYFLEDIMEISNYVLQEDSKYTRKVKDSFELLNIHVEKSNPKILTSIIPKDKVLDENLTLPEIVGRYSKYSMITHKNLYIMDHEKINFELIEKVIEWIVDGCHNYPQIGSLLVFLPGISEIMFLKDILKDNRILSQKLGKYLIIPLHSSLSNEEQSLVFKKTKDGIRKIVLSTNIAETSVTIDDCVFVIDTGKMKETYFNSNQNMESLEMCWISQANALQRMGRAGRTMPGICIHLYTSFRFKHSFLAQPIPEILRISLEPLLLRIKILYKADNIDLYKSLEMMLEPPSQNSISTAIKILQNVGALDPNCMLTPLGHHLAALPVDVRIGKLILFGAIFCCVDSALTIAACLSYKNPFVTSFEKKREVNVKKKKYAIGNSDHLTILKVYKKWIEINSRGNDARQIFAHENCLSIQTLQTLADIKHQLLELLVSIGFIPVNIKKYPTGQDKVLECTGIELNVNNDNYTLLQGLLCAALYPNVVKVFTPEKSFQMQFSGAIPRQPKPEELRYQTKEDGKVNIHPSSINSCVGFYTSPYLIFQEKIKTSRIFIKEVTMVPVLCLILFSGSGIDIQLHNDTFILSLEDGWIMFAVESYRIAKLLQCARTELVKLLQQKMEDPLLNLLNHPHGKKIIKTIVRILTDG